MELTPDWPPPSPPSGSSRAAQHNSNTTTTGAAATPPPPSRKPASKRRLAVLSHPPLPSASFPSSHSFTFHSLPFTSLLPPRRKRRDERGRGGGWRERRGQKDIFSARLDSCREKRTTIPRYSSLYAPTPFSSIIVPISSLSITGTWMDKQRNADQFEYRELGYPLFEIFAKALSLSPSLLLVSISLSLSLSLSDPARFDQEALLFSTYS